VEPARHRACLNATWSLSGKSLGQSLNGPWLRQVEALESGLLAGGGDLLLSDLHGAVELAGGYLGCDHVGERHPPVDSAA
jgi:hypothetical protein